MRVYAGDEKMKKEMIILGILMISVFSYSFGIDVYLIDENGNKYYTQYFDKTGTYSYADISVDKGIEICGGDFDGKWVALAYAQNSTTLNYIAISRNGSIGSSAGIMTLLHSDPNNPGCAKADPADFVIMGTEISSNIPEETSAYPARVWAIISDTPDLSGNVTFIPTNITLVGNYEFNDYQYTYDPNTGNVSVQLKDVKVNDGSTVFSIKNDKYWSSKYFFLGTCEDQYGQYCYQSVNGTGSYFETTSLSLYTGHKNVDDQNPHDMYLVANGLGYPLNLGADLIVNSISVPVKVYYGQNFTVNVTIENIGNVNVTHNFNVSIKFSNGYSNYQDITYKTLYNVSKYGVIQPKESKVLSFRVKATTNGSDAFALAPEQITVYATADSDNNIKETIENNNVKTSTFIYEPVYVPDITVKYNGISYVFDGTSCVAVNGTSSGVPCFPYSGRIYNVTFKFVREPDNVIPSDFNFIIVKRGGINSFVPLMKGYDGVNDIYTTVSISGNSVSVPIIPSQTTGDPNFNYIGINESIYVESPGNKFYNGTSIVDRYYLKVYNPNYENVTTVSEWKDSPYSNLIIGAATYLGKIYELLYQAFGLPT